MCIASIIRKPISLRMQRWIAVTTNFRNILFLSDLVKFAKELPLPNENEMSRINAYEFVMATKIEKAAVGSQQPESQKQETNNNEQQTTSGAQ